MVDADEVLGMTLTLARQQAVTEWALCSSIPFDSEEDFDKAQALFANLPHATQRHFYVRPNAFHVQSAKRIVAGEAKEGRTRAALRHYAKAGDAAHAMKLLGVTMDPDVEQKRIAAGTGEVLAADLYVQDHDEDQLEARSEEAASAGLYDAVGWDAHAEDAMQAAIREEIRVDLLPRVRKILGPRAFTIFMLSQVSERSLREVSEIISLSHSQVNTILTNAISKLRQELPEWA